MISHILKDYPFIQKIGENQKFKMKKDNNKAMIAAWSVSESRAKAIKNTCPIFV